MVEKSVVFSAYCVIIKENREIEVCRRHLEVYAPAAGEGNIRMSRDPQRGFGRKEREYEICISTGKEEGAYV